MARILSREPSIDRVVGVDIVPPREDIGGAEFFRADIRNPVISKVLLSTGADTVVHMGVISTPVQAGGRSTMKEINVIGSMQLLAACQRVEQITKVIVKSSSTVYGSGPKDPALFTEDTEPRHPPTSGWAKDSVDVEGYVRAFSRRRPDVSVTTLRFANFIGPKADTPMAEYFALPLVPTVLGHDARLQFIYEDDGLEVIKQATLNDHSGVYNVAGDEFLMLSQAIRQAGKAGIPVFEPLMGTVGGWVRRAGLADFTPDQIRYLTYGRGLDTTRLREKFGFTPRFTTPQAFAEFLRVRELPYSVPTERIEALERNIAHALGSITKNERSAQSTQGHGLSAHG
jgi:UDP-glucose 4-epimerase